MMTLRKSFRERFWAKVDRRGADECWPWTAYRNRDGYGTIMRDDSAGKMLAHRASMTLAGYYIPDGMCVIHSCDNPPCVNPSHLRVASHRENMADMASKGRATDGGGFCCRGEKHPDAKLTEYNVRDIRARLAAGYSGASIGRAFGVTRKAISHIKTGYR